MADPSSLPNIMQSYVMENAAQYIDDGIIWDLTDYIEEYAPDYYAFRYPSDLLRHWQGAP